MNTNLISLNRINIYIYVCICICSKLDQDSKYVITKYEAVNVNTDAVMIVYVMWLCFVYGDFALFLILFLMFG